MVSDRIAFGTVWRGLGACVAAACIVGQTSVSFAQAQAPAPPVPAAPRAPKDAPANKPSLQPSSPPAKSASDENAPAPDSEPAPRGAVPSGASGAIPVPPRAEEGAPAAPAQAVTPPKLVHFENAPYPEEAKKQGIEGDVILRLDINREGKVTQAAVMTPAGHGFDEAAVEAAKLFVFEPARRAETAVPARIAFRYSFTLSAAQPEGAGGSGASAQAGPKEVVNLAGAVVAEGDVPLAGAIVIARDAQGREFSATTDADGRWKLTDLEPGRYSVSVDTPGYLPVNQEEEVVEGQTTDVLYRLKAKGDALEVTVRGERPPREVTRRTIERREIERIPGTNGDALKSLQNLPGVARPPAISGLLIVRGSAPQDTNTFVDGIYVPIVYHFGGLSSVVPTEMLEKIDFYPGNFSAQYGRVMGGIVDVGLRSANSDKKFHGLAQMDLIDVRVLAEGPVPWLKGWSFLLGGRRSWVDTWLKPVLTAAGAGVTAAPVYYDYQAFLETKPTSRSQIRLGVFGSDDRFEVLLRDGGDNPQMTGDLGLHTGFLRFEASYRNQISDALRFSTVTAYGYDLLDFGVGQYYFNLKYPALINRTELAYKLLDGVTINTGIDMQVGWYEANVRAPQVPRPGEPSRGPISGPALTLTSEGTAYRPAAYVDAEITPTASLRIVPSVRADYARDTKAWDIGPRINARYDIVHDFPRTTVKGGVGLYHQPPQFQETSPVFGTPGIVSNRATHVALGLEQDVTRQVEFSVEGFYKKLDRLVSRTPNEAGTYDYNNLGRGTVYGAEVLLKYKPDDRFFGWLAYTLSRSTREWPPDYDLQPFQYDQTHILTVLGSYRLGRGWEFGARFRFVSGNLYTPRIGSMYSSDAGSYAGISGDAYSQRYSPFHQLDLRVDKSWKYSGWTLRTYVDLQNAYNRANPEAVAYNYNYSKSQIVGFLPIIPSIGIRGEF